MDFTVTIPHSLTLKQAADRLQSTGELPLTKVTTVSEGEQDGYSLKVETEMVAGKVTARVRGAATRLLTRIVPESVAQTVIENRLRKALED